MDYQNEHHFQTHALKDPSCHFQKYTTFHQL